MAEEKISFKGTVDDIVYSNDESGFQILKFLPEGEPLVPITLKGNFSGITSGEILVVEGKWSVHKKFGAQFEVASFQFVAPETKEGIAKYLAATLKGVGPVTAGNIVKEFGKKIFDILDKRPERLREIEGIGEKKTGEIKESWEKHKGIKDIVLFLQEYGVSPAYALRIYRQYGKGTTKAVKNNPYLLAHEVEGIGFKTADKIAGKMGVKKDSSERVAAGLNYVLEKAREDGHIFLPRGVLSKEAGAILEVEKERVEAVLSKLTKKGVFVGEKERVYLPTLWQIERKTAGNLNRLIQSGQERNFKELEDKIADIEKSRTIEFSEKQREAIKDSLTCGIFVLTGGPGTGKTTTILGIIELCEKEGFSVALASPTGRAAKRMAEASGREAKTIHRLLKFSPHRRVFLKNEDDPLSADVVIIDETSMVDIFLMNSLLSALKDGANLVLVGDSDQLPSVGAGNVLWDIIDSGKVPVVRLGEIFRQERESEIVLNAHKINQGIIPYVDNKKAKDFFFIVEDDPAVAAESIRDLAAKRVPEKYHLSPGEDIQVLSPMYKGELGVRNLNQLLGNALNGKGRRIAGGRLRLGDKVMQIRNNYDKDVFNGDIGIIEGVDEEEKAVTVRYGGREVEYAYDEMEELVLAYAISVHKSQGSEYPVVIMPVSCQHYIMLQRNLIYTGISRAKKMVILVGTKRALAIAVKNDKVERRYTTLVERLKNG